MSKPSWLKEQFHVYGKGCYGRLAGGLVQMNWSVLHNWWHVLCVISSISDRHTYPCLSRSDDRGYLERLPSPLCLSELLQLVSNTFHLLSILSVLDFFHFHSNIFQVMLFIKHVFGFCKSRHLIPSFTILDGLFCYFMHTSITCCYTFTCL